MASISYVAHKLSAAGLTVEVDGAFILAEDPDCGFERSHDGVKGISGFLKETLDEYEMALLEAAELLVAEYQEDYETEQDLTDAAEAHGEEIVAWSEEEQRAQADLELLEIAHEEERLANEAAGPDEEFGAEAFHKGGDEFPEEPWEMSPEYMAAEQEEPVNFVERLLEFLGLSTAPAADPPAREFAPSPPVKDHVPASEQLALARQINGEMRSTKEIAQALLNNDQDRGGIPNAPDYADQIRDNKMEVAMSGVVHTEKVEFRVTGTGWHTGKFSRSFNAVGPAKAFAQKCVAAAVNENYAATVKLTPWYS